MNIQLNDIKADNVLLDEENRVRMIDLGNAQYVGETTLMGFYGTPEEAIMEYSHVAPEMFLTYKVNAVSQNYSIVICQEVVFFNSLLALPIVQ